MSVFWSGSYIGLAHFVYLHNPPSSPIWTFVMLLSLLMQSLHVDSTPLKCLAFVSIAVE
jgi:hypothetical protein